MVGLLLVVGIGWSTIVWKRRRSSYASDHVASSPQPENSGPDALRAQDSWISNATSTGDHVALIRSPIPMNEAPPMYTLTEDDERPAVPHVISANEQVNFIVETVPNSSQDGSSSGNSSASSPTPHRQTAARPLRPVEEPLPLYESMTHIAE